MEISSRHGTTPKGNLDSIISLKTKADKLEKGNANLYLFSEHFRRCCLVFTTVCEAC